jgi:hypothetical protein
MPIGTSRASRGRVSFGDRVEVNHRHDPKKQVDAATTEAAFRQDMREAAARFAVTTTMGGGRGAGLGFRAGSGVGPVQCPMHARCPVEC